MISRSYIHTIAQSRVMLNRDEPPIFLHKDTSIVVCSFHQVHRGETLDGRYALIRKHLNPYNICMESIYFITGLDFLSEIAEHKEHRNGAQKHACCVTIANKQYHPLRLRSLSSSCAKTTESQIQVQELLNDAMNIDLPRRGVFQ